MSHSPKTLQSADTIAEMLRSRKENDSTTMMTNLLNEIMFYCQVYGIDYDYAERMANYQFQDEVRQTKSIL